jgi:uncharacterized Zn-binding protein involved in type VI secretion
MPAAAILFSATSHPGVISGPGIPNVRIAGQPAAVLGDGHVCGFPIPPGHPSNMISKGSTKVRIGTKPAARVGDLCACGAQIEVGVLHVNIG